MPGDLRDPEQSQPFYYDQKYEHTQRPFSENSDINVFLKAIASDLGLYLDGRQLNLVKEQLEKKNCLYKNFGDESFRQDVIKIIKNFDMAGKVARKCQI